MTLSSQISRGGTAMEILLFKLDASEHAETYGIDVANIREILHTPLISRIPGAGPDIEGVVVIRGEVITVVDMAKVLRLRDAFSSGKLMVVAMVRGHMVGLTVDSVDTILRVDASQIHEPPDVLRGPLNIIAAVVRAQDKRLVSVLNIDQLKAEPVNADEARIEA